MRLLIVGKLEGHITAAAKIAVGRGAKVTHAEDIVTALKCLREGKGADLVMVDITQPVRRFIDSLAQERITVEVVACGIGNDADAAVQAIEAGAKEYVPLPPDAELIAAVLEAVATESHQVIHRDPAMKKLLALAAQIAPSDASVLVTGESGTGKEVISNFIHRQSKRASGKFVSLNCAAIPENLLESELFGHEKGAFTGAVARRVGKFEEANGGTLLLDEVTEMHPRLQAKLLRAIQERVIDRVGGTEPVSVDIRLIATSNRDMAEAVADGQFREDLYFRLNVFNLAIPPLRKRPGDIIPLSNFFIEKYAKANGVPALPLGEAATQALEAHQWRGNVRELENTMHRAVLLATGDAIEPAAIMLSSTLSVEAEPEMIQLAGGDLEEAQELVGRTVADVEKELILNTLDHCLGNRTHAANILGISIRTLRNKLNAYEGVQSGVGA